MEDLMKYILEYFETTRKKLTYESAKKVLKIKGEKQTEIFNSALNTLVENGCLFFDDKKGEYETIKNRPNVFSATLCFDKNGLAYIKKDNKNIYIEAKDLNGALAGDSILVNNFYEKIKKYYGKVLKIIKRSENKVILKVVGDGTNAKLVSPIGFNNNINIILPKKDMMKLVNGNHIAVTVSKENNNGLFKAELEEIIDGDSDIKISTQLIAKKFNVETKFSEDALKEARSLPQEVLEEELIGRVDLRDKKFFTIDCDNTKDRDDAIHVEKLDNGNYKLYTSISHVSHYVKRGSALFNEAFKRCFSHYPNDDCIPMLPKELSNGICSLNEKVDRLVRTFEMEIDPDGNIINFNTYKAVINSKKEMTYSAVNKVLDREYVSELYEFKDDIFLINELNQILEKRKEKNDCIDFNIKETDFIRDNNDSIVDLIEKPRGYAEKIIENFMIVTNNNTSEEYSWAPIIYRVHPEPEIENIKKAINIICQAGCNINKNISINEFNSKKVIKNIIEELDKSEDKNIFNQLLVQSMKRAEYSTQNCGHYALGLYSYSHTTSPIRRFADLILHIMIDEIEEGTFEYSNWEYYVNYLNNVCVNINKAERLDFEMEKTAEAINIASYASNHIGEEVKARITEIGRKGIKLVTNNHIIGILDFNDMEGCNCYYDKIKNQIIDRNHKGKYNVGKQLDVEIKSADKNEGIVHFQMNKTKQKIKSIC